MRAMQWNDVTWWSTCIVVQYLSMLLDVLDGSWRFHFEDLSCLSCFPMVQIYGNMANHRISLHSSSDLNLADHCLAFQRANSVPKSGKVFQQDTHQWSQCLHMSAPLRPRWQQCWIRSVKDCQGRLEKWEGNLTWQLQARSTTFGTWSVNWCLPHCQEKSSQRIQSQRNCRLATNTRTICKNWIQHELSLRPQRHQRSTENLHKL
jgi:hypothetical protein